MTVNKYFGAFLAMVFVVMSVAIVSDSIFYSKTPETPGYLVEAAQASSGSAPAKAALEPVIPLLANADVAAGEKLFKKCVACHTSEEGGATKTGPNLYNIVNKQMGSNGDFGYSSALTAFAADGNKVWDYPALNAFIAKPKSYIKGTAMSFPGLKKVDDRANLIAYLRSLSANPAPIEAPAEPAASEGEAAPASE